MRLLGSPLRQSAREEAGSVVAWVASVSVFALVLGVISASITSAGISASIREQLAKFGTGSILTPTGYLSFTFLFFVLAVSLFACSQVNAVRHEEASGRLQTLLSLPISRVHWFAGRLMLAALSSAVIALAAGFMTWVGAATQDVGVSFGDMIGAGANCLPVSLLFLGVSAIAFAAMPRAGAAVAYALVAISFLWQLVGSLLSAPQWLLELTPFAHIGMVPAQGFRALDAAVLLALGLLLALAATAIFARRDLVEE
jgi:ABC-2 type transport system permease protein